jgi:N-acetyl-S-(2-succino)cysteine monooxygenase
MHLTVALAEPGWHPASWRFSSRPAARLAPFAEMAETAERAGIDALLLGLPAAPESRRMHPTPRVHLDPLPLLGSLIARTQRIGLAAYWATDMAEPFHVARVLATLDHLSGGRSGWIVGRLPRERLRRAFGQAVALDDAAGWARTDEFVDVVGKLWDSWEDGGFAVDQQSGVFADADRVHPIRHEGAHFKVRGPLNVPRPVQGQPVVIWAGADGPEVRAVAAASAELVLAACPSPAEARTLRNGWREAASRAGRDPDAVRLMMNVMPILGANPAQAARRAAEADALAEGPPAVDPDAPVPTPAQRFVGTPAEFSAMLAAWIEGAACDGFNILPAIAAQDLAILAQEVVPMLQQQGLRPHASRDGTLRERLGLARTRSRFAV